MKANTNKLIQELKAQGQDFEWYPTTDEMLQCLMQGIKKTCQEQEHYYKNSIHKILDIGAGDGRVLQFLSAEFDAKSYMIELATQHIENYEFGFVVGRDFYNTSLIEKDMDLIFCNPPYSEFEAWACRIIKEANAEFIALILPQRWKNSKLIELALNSRVDIKETPEILGSFDFENAERKARAKVDILLIKTSKSYDCDELFADFLKREFDLCFDGLCNKSYEEYEKRTQEQEEFKNGVRAVAKNNVIDYLIDKYNAEMAEFVKSLKSLQSVNFKILQSLNIDKEKIIKSIKTQLKQLKGRYWHALFEELESINSRITEKYRQHLSSQVASEAQVEFTKENIHAIVIWLIKNANNYIEKSYLDLFDRMSRDGNALLYKSNERFSNDEWRYNSQERNEKEAHKLDYRIVVTFATDSYEIVDMIQVIANNLGYKNTLIKDLGYDFVYGCSPSYSQCFRAGRKDTIYATQNGKQVILLEYKAYQNKNVHIKFNKDFMGELNLAVGKIRQWLRSKDEARAEFKDLKETSLKKIFDKSLLLCKNDTPLCLGHTPQNETSKMSENENLFSEEELAG